MQNVSADYLSVVRWEMMLDFVPEFLVEYVEGMEYHPWIFSAAASILIGLSGIFPLLVIPIYDPSKLKDGEGLSEGETVSLKTALSFAVGGMLGDVFLHLLPEAWSAHRESGHASTRCGLWVLFGMLAFIIVEKLFAGSEGEEGEDENPAEEIAPSSSDKSNSVDGKDLFRNFEIEELYNAVEKESVNRKKHGASETLGTALPSCDGDAHLLTGCLFNGGETGSCLENTCNGIIADGVSKGRCIMGNRWMGRCILREHKSTLKTLTHTQAAHNNNNTTHTTKGPHQQEQATKSKHVAGYLNLMANSIDNFTHGLAVGGSFIVSLRVGILTTFAILVHEIPHEVGDFAILLKSGFTRWEAAKAQLATASAGLVGAMTAVLFSGAKNAIEAKTSWIVPFTAGGFLHIALVTVLPDLVSEPDPKQAIRQLAALLMGTLIMGLITVYFE